MWRGFRNASVVAGLAMGAILPATIASAVTTDPLLSKANSLAHRVHQFHQVGFGYDAAFGPPEDDYCRTMRKANWTMTELESAANNAAASGDFLGAAAYRLAADNLGDELDEESYLDWKYGDKDYCSPTAWDSIGPYDGPTLYTGFSFQPTLEFGVSSFRADNFIDTTLPSSASGGFNGTNTSLGIDLRARIPLVNNFSLAVGGGFKQYYGGSLVRAFDLDAFSPGNDTQVTLERKSSALVYGGVSYKNPTISAYRNGTAGQPGAGTFDTTFWAGYRRDSLDGNIFTNENGLLRDTGFSRSVNGFSLGLDVDYPLWYSGFDSLWSRNVKPVVRAGFQYDHFNDLDVGHQANFGFYQDKLQIRDSVTFKIGVGLQFYPAPMTAPPP